MKFVKYLSMVNEVSKLEGRKEQLRGQQNLSEKLSRRGEISAEDFVLQLESYHNELRVLEQKKRSAIRQYLAA